MGKIKGSLADLWPFYRDPLSGSQLAGPADAVLLTTDVSIAGVVHRSETPPRIPSHSSYLYLSVTMAN